MFIRKKKNKSGTVSIQIIDKSYWKYKVVKTIGSSWDKNTIEKFLIKADQFLNKKNPNQTQLFVNEFHDDIVIQNFLEWVSNLQICNPFHLNQLDFLK